MFVGQSLDTVKVKMQTFPHLYNNMITCFKQTFMKDGIRVYITKLLLYKYKSP